MSGFNLFKRYFIFFFLFCVVIFFSVFFVSKILNLKLQFYMIGLVLLGSAVYGMLWGLLGSYTSSPQEKVLDFKSREEMIILISSILEQQKFYLTDSSDDNKLIFTSKKEHINWLNYYPVTVEFNDNRLTLQAPRYLLNKIDVKKLMICTMDK